MHTVKRLTKYILPHRTKVLLMSVGLLGFMALEMVPPLLLKRAIDDAIPQEAFSLLAWLAVAYVAVAALRGALSYLQWHYSELLGQSITRDLQLELHDKLQSLHHQYFRKQKTGDIMERVTGDMRSVAHLLSWSLMLFSQNCLTLLGALAVLLIMNTKLALISLAGFPLMFLIVMRFDKRVRPIWRQVRQEMSQLTTVLQENISGVRTVKAFAREEYEIDKFDRQNSRHLEVNLTRVGIESTALPLIDFVSGLSIVLLLAVGGRQVIAGTLTLGTLVAFQSYIWKLIWPIRSMGWIINSLEQALTAAPRLFEILDTPSDIEDREDAQEAPAFRGHIEFDQVSFQFADSQEPMLKNITFTVEPGQIIAVLGTTGSGKSTLVNLIPRMFDVTEGAIRIDGQDIKSYSLHSLRSQIGMVMQDTFLFSASIAENISYGNPEATEAEIKQAAALAQAAGFIEAMPKGYDTPIGERGVGLSGGQKQRVALARALLMDPSILILDEATSSVDSSTEDLIQEALEHVMPGRTSIIIAKRLSTIKQADLVVVVEDGAVAEMGSPKELLAGNGAFRRIYESQKLEISEEDPAERGADYVSL